MNMQTTWICNNCITTDIKYAYAEPWTRKCEPQKTPISDQVFKNLWGLDSSQNQIFIYLLKKWKLHSVHAIKYLDFEDYDEDDDDNNHNNNEDDDNDDNL